MQTRQSRDGATIAFAVSGEGPALVLIHGTSADHTRWAPVLPALERRFTVYAVDRRGRGQSSDGESYAIEREFEDATAVIDSIGAPVFLLGHSYGAIVALEAAMRTSQVAKLVLYEPPIALTRTTIEPPETIARLEALLQKGDRDAVVSTFLREVAHVPPGELEMIREAPSWKARVAAAHTIPREERGANEYRFPSSPRIALVRMPTLLLLGGDSPPFLRDPTMLLQAALPSATLSVMPGQQHVAMNSAPELFAREVIGFLAPAHAQAR